MELFAELVRFGGGLFLEGAFAGDWCVRSKVSSDDCPPGVNVGEGLMAFHFVLSGKLEVQVRGGPVQTAVEGDLILLPRNTPHLLGSRVSQMPLDVRRYLKRGSDGSLAQLVFGAEPHEQMFVCGFISLAVSNHPLIGSLPELIVASLRNAPAAEWARSTFRYAAQEHASGKIGSQQILARIAEVLFTEAIREYAKSLDAGSTGWLAAMKDPALCRALVACHQRPQEAWTSAELARVAGMSRSSFAELFKHQLGCPPMTYVTQWRMNIASRRLIETNDTLAQISAEVGYESESTFSRAFARERGCAPGEWRRQARSRKAGSV